MTTSILEDAAELERLGEMIQPVNSIDVLSDMFDSMFRPKRYLGCWAEEGNSEWAGFAPGTYATQEKAIEAARKAAWGCRRAVRAWACEEEAV